MNVVLTRLWNCSCRIYDTNYFELDFCVWYALLKYLWMKSFFYVLKLF